MVGQVLAQLVGLAIGLATGLATGFYFERRASKETRRQNTELRAELETLRTSVYTVGANDEVIVPNTSPPEEVSASEVVRYAKMIQNAEGLVRRSLLIQHFASNGFRPESVNHALQLAEESGNLSTDGLWVTIR